MQRALQNTDAGTIQNCQEILRQLGFIKRELSTLKIERSRKINEINHYRTRESEARRRQREIEQDRPSPDAERSDRPTRRRLKTSNADTEQKSLRRFLGRIISTVAESALFAQWVTRVRQAERDTANQRKEIARLEQELAEIDHQIAQKLRSDETLRNNWTTMSCSTAIGRSLPGRY